MFVEQLESRTHLSASRHTKHHAARPPRYTHIVIVVEENKSRGDVLGNNAGRGPSLFWTVTPPNPLHEAAYLNQLARFGADMTNAHAETHPSLPNYLAMFSGSTQGVSSDAPPKSISETSLAGELHSAGLSFKSYAEDLPAVGSRAEHSGDYFRRHNPAAIFSDVPASDIVPFSGFPQTAKGFKHLPKVSMVIPNITNDMHSGSVRRGDRWLRKNISRYARWCRTHHSLLIVTFDEGSGNNNIPTIFYGAQVRRTQSDLFINHYSILRMIEDMYDLPRLGAAATAPSVRETFSRASIG
jgi:acid phosphatase